MQTNRPLRETLDRVPDGPGVYLMKDAAGAVIYIGKARSLSRRVGSYFSRPSDERIARMVARVADIETIPVASEAEALLLENRFIKEMQPRFNVNLKDGKTYPYVRISREEFPRVSIVREKPSRGGRYFGPFSDVRTLRKVLQFLLRYYPVRHCSRTPGARRRPCMESHIGRCAGVCNGAVDRAAYLRNVEGLASFFSGRHRAFESKLRGWMREAAARLDFEEAQRLKERLLLLDTMKSRFPLREESSLGSWGKENLMERLRAALDLPRTPGLVEGYDISTLFGSGSAGAAVAFMGGLPWKDGYRRFRIRETAGMDDFAMLAEVMRHRFDDDGRRAMPDLLLIDGGRGQLSAVLAELRRMKLDIPAAALAKENDDIFLPGSPRPVRLPPESPELLFLKRVRDEAHRFALKYHGHLESRRATESVLDGIPGIGPARRRAIRAAFPDAAALAAADPSAVADLGVPAAAAARAVERARRSLHAAFGAGGVR